MRGAAQQMEHHKLGGGAFALKTSWSKEFSTPRSFEKHSQNQAYIDYIQEQYLLAGVTHELVSDDESGGCRLGDEEEGGESDGESVDDTAGEDDVEDVIADRDDGKAVRNDNAVEIFMKGLEGLEDDEIFLPYWNQVEVVTEFCAGTNLVDLSQGNPGAEALSLLYDDSCSSVERPKKQKRKGLDRCLTPQQLFGELRKQRYQNDSVQDHVGTTTENGLADVKRRLLYAVNPNGWIILAITATAPRLQALTLKNFFYRYLTGRSSITATISAGGFKTFSLDLHLSYYIIHGSKLLHESRQRQDGKPLRQRWKLPSIRSISAESKSTPREETPEVEYMQEAQFSLCFIGTDDLSWTAYSFVDPGHREIQKSGSVPPDPLTAGLHIFDHSNENPRVYFIRTLELRVRPILKEWHRAERWAEAEITGFDSMPVPLEINSRDAKQVRSRSVWVNDMVKILRHLTRKLSKFIKAWQAFQGQGIGYFFEDELQGKVPSLATHLDMVDAVFSELKTILANLEDLAQIVVEIRLSVNSHLSFENHLATVFQQKTAGHVKVLTVITIVFQPLVLTQGLFSTQGVLPFKPDLPSFIYALLLSSLLVGTTSAVLFNWDKWCQWLIRVVRSKLVHKTPALKRSRRRRKDHNDSTGNQNEVHHTGAATSLPKLKGGIFRSRPRKHKLKDIERGTELSDLKQA